MAKDPAMLWYWNDWHSGTVTLSRFLKGCYIDLLHAQFNSGHLSLEDVKTVLGPDFSQSWDILKKKFEQDSAGLFFNKRLEEEKNKRMAFTKSRRDNKLKSLTYDRSHEKHMIHHMENENENINDNENKDKNGVETKFDAKDALLKMGVDSNLADEWLKVRKNKHLTNTRTAFLKIWREIKKTDLTANDCIKAAIENSWGGFQADWLTNSKFAKKGHKNDESSLTNPEVYKNIKFT